MNIDQVRCVTGRLLAAVVLASCSGEGELSEPIDTAQQPISVTACSGTIHHGGSLWGYGFPAVVGCDCPAPAQKLGYSATMAGSGSCSVTGWASGNPNDCRIVVQVNNYGWYTYGDCNWTVTKDVPVLNDSCVTRCGGVAPTGCWCDALCSLHGNCCADYNAVCNH